MFRKLHDGVYCAKLGKRPGVYLGGVDISNREVAPVSRVPNRLLILAVGGARMMTAGCASTVALDRAVLAYHTTTAESVSKQLLVNIARARRNEPMHFTAVSNIAATYKFTVNAGLGGALTGERGGRLIPLIGGSAEENPTVSISPMQGDAFTQRLLTPFVEQKLTLLLRQGYDVDSLLRLMGAELRLQYHGPDKVAVHRNRPSARDGYAVYRRVVAHLSAIQDLHALHVEPLHFQRTWTVPATTVTPETFTSIYQDFSLNLEADRRAYRVSKRVNGRVMITNYDPAILTNEERLQLHAEAEEAPAHDVGVDIRSGYPGGEYPLRGRLRLRSFHEVVTFIGRGLDEEPEFHVPPDPRTPAISENSVHTLEIVDAQQSRPAADLSVEWRGYHYAVRDQSGYQWNKKAFSLLYQFSDEHFACRGARAGNHDFKVGAGRMRSPNALSAAASGSTGRTGQDRQLGWMQPTAKTHLIAIGTPVKASHSMQVLSRGVKKCRH